ncbi:MAG: hypothetical protein ACTS44_01120 [Candidatus Hodgkinia cicadicola]
MRPLYPFRRFCPTEEFCFGFVGFWRLLRPAGTVERIERGEASGRERERERRRLFYGPQAEMF